MWCRHGTLQSVDPPASVVQDGIAVSFSLNISEGNGRLYPFLALGGDVLAKANQATLSNGTTTSITGLGFGSYRPKAIIFASNNHAAEFGDSPGFIGAPVNIGWGAADGHGNQFSIGGGSIYLGTDERRKRMHNDACLFLLDPYTGNLWWSLSLTSMDVDGFTVSHAAGLGGTPFAYLAIYSPSSDIRCGIATQGDASISLPWRPGGILTMSHGGTSLNAVADDFNMMAGVASDSAQVDPDPWCGQWNHTHMSDADARGSLTRSIASFIEEDSGWSLRARGTVSAWNSDSVSLSWPTNDAAGRLFGYVAFQRTQLDPFLQPVALICPKLISVSAATDVIDDTGQLMLGLASSSGNAVSIGLRDNRAGVGSLNNVSGAVAGMDMYFSGTGTRYNLTSNGIFVPLEQGQQIYRYDHM